MKHAVNTYLIDSTDNAISIAKLAKQDPKLTRWYEFSLIKQKNFC